MNNIVLNASVTLQCGNGLHLSEQLKVLQDSIITMEEKRCDNKKGKIPLKEKLDRMYLKSIL